MTSMAVTPVKPGTSMSGRSWSTVRGSERWAPVLTDGSVATRSPCMPFGRRPGAMRPRFDRRGRHGRSDRYPCAHATLPPLLRHAPRRPGRRRDAVPSAAPARRLRAPAGLGDLLAAAARVPRQPARRADHPRGDGPDRVAGDGDAGRPSRRRVAPERSLRRDRPRDGPVQGSQRARHGPRDDPRGSRGAAPRRHREVVPPAPDDGLPLPDEVARRAARPRRPHPRPRIRHEGRLQHAIATRPAWTSATGRSTARTSGSSSASGSRRSPSHPTSG